MEIAHPPKVVFTLRLLTYKLLRRFFFLSHRVLAALRAISDLCSVRCNAEIAQSLSLTEATIEQYPRSAYRLLGVKKRADDTRLEECAI